MRLTRIRPGYYTTKDGAHDIERMDEAAERYPGDDSYGAWRVTDVQNREVWLRHFDTLRAARAAIGREKP